jgi:tRNA-dihydrouridine synthase B
MPLAVGNLSLPLPVLLAPMAGITDLPFRRLVAQFGAGLVVSEMVASREMVEAHRGTRAKAALDADLGPASVQLAGREARWMAEAARVCEGLGARIIDINMGCPAKKVTGGWSGSALMRDPDHALRLIEAVVEAVSVPVTLKMRLGWDEGQRNAPELARRAEAAGIRMVTVHGRTRCQFYHGAADWAGIRAVKAAVGVPVIANGDVTDAASARAALAASGADGVMVGRGARGRPWALAGIAAALAGSAPPPVPGGRALADLILGHYEAILGFHGRDVGMRVARKHLGWYLEPLGLRALRDRLVRLEDPGAVMAALASGLGASADTGALPEAA